MGPLIDVHLLRLHLSRFLYSPWPIHSTVNGSFIHPRCAAPLYSAALRETSNASIEELCSHHVRLDFGRGLAREGFKLNGMNDSLGDGSRR